MRGSTQYANSVCTVKTLASFQLERVVVFYAKISHLHHKFCIVTNSILRQESGSILHISRSANACHVANYSRQN